MNRGTALLLAMAALLAHALAIHHDGLGRLAPPHELAHAAYHLARNLVREGRLVWSLAEGAAAGGIESYPSPMLVLVAIGGERIYSIGVTTFSQIVGLVAALLTVGLSASFSTDRIAGVIPPVLLVASGGMAAAAVSGTEVPLLTLFASAAFVAFEHRWSRRFSIALALLVATRPEGVLLALAFAILALAERLVPRRDGSPPTPLLAFAPAALAASALFALRGAHGESYYGSLLAELFATEAERVATGLRYLLDFALTSVTPLIACFAVAAALVGRLSGAGLRALALAAVFAATVVLRGGGSPVFCLDLVPALPLLAVAVQQGLIAMLDSHLRWLERVAWTACVIGVFFSALASKFPGDLGPIPAYEWHRGWMRPYAAPPFEEHGAILLGSEREWLGRRALAAEIQTTGQMRLLGAYLREHVEPEHSIATPWPGALGYLSGMRVVDLFGRVPTTPGRRTLMSGTRPPAADLVAVLEERPDFLVPGLVPRSIAQLRDFDHRLAAELAKLDVAPADGERQARVRALLAEYELFAAPVLNDEGARRFSHSHPFLLLRRRELAHAPRLEVSAGGGRVRVDAHAPRGGGERAGETQLVNLRVQLLDRQGRPWYFTPTGELSKDSRVLSRLSLLLFPLGERPMRLFEAPLPGSLEGEALLEVRASLLNPGTRGMTPLAIVGREERVPVQ